MPYWNICCSIWRNKYLLLFLPFLAIFPYQQTQSCGPVDYSFRGYSFMEPNLLMIDTRRAPLFLDFNVVYENYKGQKAAQQLGNLEEWQERFCDWPKLADIQQVIYQSTLTDLQMIRSALERDRNSLPYNWQGNSFIAYLKRSNCLEVIDYLIYAKRCEPHVIAKESWDPNPRNVAVMQTLINQAKQIFTDLESHYVRLRYAYQMIRLAHYMGDYEQTLELYDWLMPKTDNDPSIIEYWIEGHRAGALLKLGQRVEAAYLYAKIYENCPSKRISAWRSFSIQSDEEWDQLFLLCKNDHERATLHAIRANNPKSNRVQEMQNIYALEPNNSHLELLLVKQMHELEKDLLGLEFNDQKAFNSKYFNRPSKYAGQTVIDLLDFVEQVLEEKQTKQLELWRIADFYLQFLAGNDYYAQRTLNDITPKINNPKLKAQLDAWTLAFKIANYQTITDEIEEEVGNMKRINPIFQAFPDFEDFTNDRLSYLYKTEAHPGKAFRMHYPLEAMLPNPQMDIVDDLLEVCEKTSRHYLERKMVERGDSTIKNDLLDIKATVALQKNQLEAALELYKDIGRTDWDNYGLFAPFIERINDCVYCPLPDTAVLYNKGELIEAIRSKDYDARSNSDKSAKLFYEVGLAYYNMTYFGHAWEAMDYFRSGSSLSRFALNTKDGVAPHYYYPFGNKENLDCSTALDYFERTLQLARNSNPELAARAAFMAAKCEQNIYYVNRYKDASKTYYYFNLLADEFWNTEFVQRRVIKECKYFEAYVY